MYDKGIKKYKNNSDKFQPKERVWITVIMQCEL